VDRLHGLRNLTPAFGISILNEVPLKKPKLLNAYRYLFNVRQHQLVIIFLLSETLAEKDAQQTGTDTNDNDKNDFYIRIHLNKRPGCSESFIMLVPRHI
jgi:hypothetical protein